MLLRFPRLEVLPSLSVPLLEFKSESLKMSMVEPALVITSGDAGVAMGSTPMYVCVSW